MNNADLPAMPQSVVDKEYWRDFMTGTLGGAPTGLTKREHFAGLAMQGLLGTVNAEWYSHHSPIKKLAENAVEVADALLKELEK